MVAGAVLVLFWGLMALIGAVAALAFLFGMKGTGS